MAWDIHDAVEARGRDAPRAPLVVDDEGVHTAGEVLEHARAVAGAVPATGKVARGRAAEIACERVGLTRSTTDTGD